MAKFAVLFVAALAFQAAFGGVVTRQFGSPFYDNQVVGHYEGFKPGQLQAYVAQIQTVANQLSASFQYAHPNSIKTLTMQSRELAQAVAQIVDRLQAEIHTHSGPVDAVLEQVFRELREIQVALQQGFVDISSAYQYQHQLSAYVQDVAHQIEKLVYLVKYHYPEAQGGLYVTIQAVLGEFLTAIQHIQGKAYPQDHQGGLYGQGLYQGEHYSQKYGQMGYPMGLFGYSGYRFHQAGKGLAIQLQVVASDVSAALQHVYLDNVVVKHTLAHLIRNYVQHLEVVVESLEQVSYAGGHQVLTQQHVAQNLRQIIASLQQFVSAEVSINAYEIRNQLSLYVQNIASELKKLTYGAQPELEQLVGVKLALVRYLTATRHLYVQLQYISQVAHRGQTHAGFGYQVQVLANSLSTSLESISVDSLKARQVLAEQSREFAQHIQAIIERIQTLTDGTPYGANVPQQVATNLRHVVASLQQDADFENAASAQKLKMHLIAYIQEAATEIQKLFWVGQQAQGEYYNTPIYGIFNDFVAALQNQQVQLYGMYQFNQYGQGAQQLVHQIQAITNNVAIFLQNAPFTGEHAKQVEIQARRLAYNIESIIQRLEVESMYTQEHGAFQKVVEQLRQLVASLEQVTAFEGPNSVYELNAQFNVVLQNVAAVFKKLAYAAQFEGQNTQGNFYFVVRSVLVQYLNVIEHVQLRLQGISQAVQIGQHPRELALQIQVAAHRLSEMFYVVPDSRQTYSALVYQARRIAQLFDVVVSKLHYEATANGQAYPVFQQIANNLHQIQMSLHQAVANVQAVSPYQLKVLLAARIQDAAVEFQKLMYVAPYEAQQAQLQGGVYALVKNVLIDFLAGLQNLQMQVQDHLQVSFVGQNPRALSFQIQSVAQRLFAYFQYIQPHSQQFRQIMVIQVGELAQTIEHVVQMLQTEIKHSGENEATLKQVAAHLNEIALGLQQVNGFESHNAQEFATQFAVYIQKIVAEFHKLAYVAQYKVQETEVGYYHGGVLNGVFNSVLASFRNIYIQVHGYRYMGYYGHNTQYLATQIQTVTNHLAETLHLIAPTSKTVKQALAIQTFRYARHIQNIVDRLQSEGSYSSQIIATPVHEVAQNLRQIVVALQQIAGSWTTETVTDLRTQLIAQVQQADAEIQKLVVAHTAVQQHQGYYSAIVKSIFIEYYAAVQNFNIRAHTIAYRSQKAETVYQLAIQVETAAIELSAFFHHVLPSNRLVAQTMSVEARQLAKVIAAIVGKFQTYAGSYPYVQQIAYHLRQVQYGLQQVAGEQTFANVHQQKLYLEANVHRAVLAIQQLVWAAQPEYPEVQVNSGVYSFIREALNDFLAAVQNVHIQIQNVVQNGQTRQFSWAWQYQAHHDAAYPEQYYAGWKLFMQNPGQYGYGYGLAGQQHYGADQQYYGGEQYYGGLGLVRGQIYQTPRQYLYYIQHVVRDLFVAFESSAFQSQQAKQIVTAQVGRFARIIETIVEELEQYYNAGSEHTFPQVQQIIYQLREAQKGLRKIVGYTTFTNGYQLKSELESYMQTVVAQLEKLVYYAQQYPQGPWYAAIKNVLYTFLNGVQEVQQQVYSVAHYGQYAQYGKQYGYAGQYGSEYPYGAQYGYQHGYPYGGQYESEYAGQHGYQHAGKYESEYSGQYGYPYGQSYGYPYGGQYESQYAGQYGSEYPYGAQYGHAGQYGYQHGYPYGQYESEYAGQYGYQHAGQYESEYAGYPYGQSYGYPSAGKYDSEYAGQYRYPSAGNYDQYSSVYGYAGQYRPYGHGQAGQYRPYVYGYGFVDQYNAYDDEYGYAGLFRPYGYGYSSQYRPYGYGYAGKYDQYDSEYGYPAQYAHQYGNEYGYSGKYAHQYATQHGYGNQYATQYGYEYQGQTVRQIAKQVETVAKQIAAQYQSYGADKQHQGQYVVYQARQLVQVIDYIVSRLHAEVRAESPVYQVISSLREIQGELQQLVSSGVHATVYPQFYVYIEKVAAKLHKLALIAESDVSVQEYVVKNVVGQYLAYLRNLQYQVQGSSYGQYQGAHYGAEGVQGQYYPKYYQSAIRGY